MTNYRFRSVSICPFRQAIIAVGAILILTPVAPAQTTLPPPESAGFEHVVVVMMENRSFDHFFGWLPGANGQQAGLIFKDSAGVQHPTHYLPPDYQGCPFLDPGHSYTDGRVQYDNGAADGWLFNGSDSSSNDSRAGKRHFLDRLLRTGRSSFSRSGRASLHRL